MYVDAANGDDGVSVTVSVTALYDTVAGTALPLASVSSTVAAVTVVGFASLNVADTLATSSVEPAVGVTLVTVGDAKNNTSTQ